MTKNKVSSESPFYFQFIHVNNILNIKTAFMQNGYRMQWYGIFPPFLIRYLAQLGLLINICINLTMVAAVSKSSEANILRGLAASIALASSTLVPEKKIFIIQ